MRATNSPEAQPLFGVGLRWLVALPTGCIVGGFIALAAVEPRAAPIALGGAVLVGVKGLGWLLYLRRNRARLRRHGFRW